MRRHLRARWGSPCPSSNGPLTRCVKLRVAHAQGMLGTFSLPPRVKNRDMHHGTCVTHVLWCMPGSLTSGSLWGRWRGKRSRHSRRMRDPHFFLSDKRPFDITLTSHELHDVSYLWPLDWFDSLISLTSKEMLILHITGPLWGEITDDQWIASQKSSNTENVSIAKRHHGKDQSRTVKGCNYANFLVIYDSSLILELLWCHWRRHWRLRKLSYQHWFR